MTIHSKFRRMAMSTLVWAVMATSNALAGTDDALVEAASGFRPPATPLVTHDPYFSAWSFSDNLTDDWPRHWTGAINAMAGMCRIDDKAYRFCGPQPSTAPAMKQVRREIWPTRTLLTFEGGGILLTATFASPLLPDDMDILSRPVTYVVLQARSADDKPHKVSVYLDVSAEWSVNTADQKVIATRHKLGDMAVLRVGTQQQAVLGRSGDNLRIDWGHMHLATGDAVGRSEVIGPHDDVRGMFASQGALPADDDMRFPRAANDDWPVLAFAVDLGTVSTVPASRTFMLAYDDLFAIEFLHRRLPAWWRRHGDGAAAMLRQAWDDRLAVLQSCKAFDERLMTDMLSVGGVGYARIGALAYRQCMAAHKLVADIDGTPLMFSKENFSNGCIATVDVIYPAAPQFLVLCPALLEAQLAPIFQYANSQRWKHPFAPHDLGTYPLANGQVYGGGERSAEGQMPVEESANMLLLAAALHAAGGKCAARPDNMRLLQAWADYLVKHGFDPEHQLCTDDFAGPSAHNTNLSIKAIVALAAFARVLESQERAADARTYRAAADRMAAQWVEAARDGDHFRLAFDKPGTWSQKYNLVWDGVLGLKVFPNEVRETELAFYRGKIGRFGLPLDNRASYTKLDWCMWTAAMTTDAKEFARFVQPLHAFVCESPSRVPLTDWFSTSDGKQSGFQARSVVGGVFMPMLANEQITRKWRAAGR